jgi:hypothetical protein
MVARRSDESAVETYDYHNAGCRDLKFERTVAAAEFIMQALRLAGAQTAVAINTNRRPV